MKYCILIITTILLVLIAFSEETVLVSVAGDNGKFALISVNVEKGTSEVLSEFSGKGSLLDPCPLAFNSEKSIFYFSSYVTASSNQSIGNTAAAAATTTYNSYLFAYQWSPSDEMQESATNDGTLIYEVTFTGQFITNLHYDSKFDRLIANIAQNFPQDSSIVSIDPSSGQQMASLFKLPPPWTAQPFSAFDPFKQQLIETYYLQQSGQSTKYFISNVDLQSSQLLLNATYNYTLISLYFSDSFQIFPSMGQHHEDATSKQQKQQQILGEQNNQELYAMVFNPSRQEVGITTNDLVLLDLTNGQVGSIVQSFTTSPDSFVIKPGLAMDRVNQLMYILTLSMKQQQNQLIYQYNLSTKRYYQVQFTVSYFPLKNVVFVKS